MKLFSSLPIGCENPRRHSTRGRIRSFWLPLLGLLPLLAAVPNTAHSQTVTNHGAGIFKNALGPTGQPMAHTGETVTVFIRVTHLDGVFMNGVPTMARDTLTFTSIVDVVHHGAPVGDVTSANLLASPVVLSNIFIPPGNDGSRILRNTTYVVQPNDPSILFDDAIAGGFDNHDAPGDTGVRQAFMITFPAQIRVLKPAICVTKICTNAVGSGGMITFSGSVSNCGNTMLTNVVVSNFVSGTFFHVLGPTNLATNQSISFTGSYPAPDPCAQTPDTLFAWGNDTLVPEAAFLQGNLSAGMLVSNTASATCSNIFSPGLVVTKSCPPGPVAPGQLLTFTGCVTNTGNITLNNVIVVNNRPVNNTPVTNFASLAPGQSMCFSGSYLVPSNVCSLPDTLTARATTICGVSITNTVTAICAVTNTPAVAITKICPNGQTLPGATLTFTGLVANIGNVALTNVVVLNDRPAPNTVVTNIASIPIGQTVTITGSYVVPANFPDCIITDTLIARGSDICSNVLVSATNTAMCLVRGGNLVISCPPATNVQCLGNVPAPNTNSVTISNSAGGVTISFVSDVTNVVGCGLEITRTYRVMDACSNVVTCTQLITVRDTTPPLITCPPNLTVQCSNNVPACPGSLAAFLALGGTATDNCDTNLTYTCTDGPLVGGTCGGTIMRTHRVVDDCTNASTCVQIITIRDTTPPVITCPPNLTLQCSNSVPACPGTLAAFLALGGTASDNCDTNLTYTCTDGPLVGGICGGTINRTNRVVDDCGNAATCVQTITIRDTTPPVITCPPNLTVQCSNSVPACPGSLAAFLALGGTASDNCDTNLTYTCTDGPLVGGICGGTINRTNRVVDDCGNVATCVQTITINDNVPPVITCPPNLTVQCSNSVPACPGSLAAFLAIGGTASDNCDTNLTYTCTDGPLVSGVCGGTINRTNRVVDDCGNVATCVQTITIRDTTPPVITCPPNLIVQCSNSVPACPGTLAAFLAIGGTASDNCDTNLTYTCMDGPLVGGVCGGTINRTNRVVDDCGNVATCVQTITINDNVPPVITCPPNLTVQCSNSVPPCPGNLAAFLAIGGTASDNCDTNLTYTCADGPLVGGLCGGTITRTNRIVDDCGNVATCLQIITIRDTVPPVITCPPNLTVQCSNNVPPCPGSLAAFLALGGTATDNCDTNLTYTCTDGPLIGGVCGGTITRTNRVVDDCGNASICLQTITIRDTVPPVIICPPSLAVQCTNDVPPCPGSLAAFLAIGGTAVDNCDTNLTYTCTDGPLIGGICGGTITRTNRVVDDCGNAAICLQTITIRDTVPPAIVCPPNLTVQCSNSVPPCPGTLAAFLAIGGTAVDNCDTNLTYTCTDGPLVGGICGGTITRTNRVVDDCGNVATCLQVITIRDTVPPAITCPPNLTVQCSNSVPACPGSLAAFLALGGAATDNCDTNLTYSCFDGPLVGGICGGTITRTHRVVDDCNNTNTCTQTITIRDTIPPVITCPPAVTVQCSNNVPACPGTLAAFLALGGTASDNCDTNLTYSCSDGPLVGGICGGTITRTHRVVDDCNNTNSCTQTITIRDTIPPMLIGVPPNTNVLCLSQIPGVATVTASDNCDPNPIVTLTSTTNGPCPTVITRTWIARDACNNSTTNRQIITVLPDQPVVLVPVANQLVCQGSNATFCVTVSNACPLTYQWFRNGVAIPGATASCYTVTNATVADVAEYCVRAMGECGSVTNCGRLTLSGALGDFVWEDINFNGVQDGGEPGVSNVTVELLTCAGTLVTSTTTGADGRYLFTCLAPGDYRVRVTRPDGYNFTMANAAGTNDCVDSDADMAGLTACVTLVSGETNLCVDTGLIRPVCVGDFVWEDLNGNGLQDMGEPGVTNVMVRLIDCGTSNVLSVTFTDTNGLYLLCASNPGIYQVEVILPGGFTITVPDSGTNDCVDSDADPGTRLTACLFLPSGTTNLCVDIGLKKPAALGDFVWEDMNFNGRQDMGEPGVSNVTVELYNCSGQLITSQLTDTDGLYLFTNLMPSNYVVRFVLPPDFQFTLPNVGSDGGDSDAGPGGNSPCTTLISGETNRTVDAGLIRPICIGDFVWEDLNFNGLQDMGEPGITNVTLRLIDCISGGVVATTNTGPGGLYLFCATNPGTYRVEIVVPAGYEITTPNVGTNNCADSDAIPGTRLTDCVVMPSGSIDLCVDIGLKRRAGIGDCVWNDLNNNGIQDGGAEVGVPNVLVRLLDCTNGVIRSTNTSAQGKYLFGNLQPGSYRIQFVPPNDCVFSPQDQGANDAVDSDANPADGRTICYTLQSGETNLTVDAGLFCPPPFIDVTKLIACLLPTNQCGPFAKTAAGMRSGTNAPAFCYSITVSNSGGAILTNIMVMDDKLGDLTAFYFPTKTTPLAPGASITRFFTKAWDVDTTNNVTVSGRSAVALGTNAPPQAPPDTDSAVAFVDEINIACNVILFSPDEQDGNTNDASLLLPGDGLPHTVVFTVMVMNLGDGDLANVTISSPGLAGLGCVDVPGPFPLGVGMMAKVTLCQTMVTCADNLSNIVFTVTAQASTNGGVCAFASNGAPVRVQTTCPGSIVCQRPGDCRVTGGGRQEDFFPRDARYVTHGGNVRGSQGVNLAFDPDSECIRGNWEHVRHQKGGNRGNFHAKSFDSIMCACLGCPENPGAGVVVGELCNEGDRVCGPEPRRAPANKICFSGVGDYVLTSGNREARSVLFRVDIEDRSEPGNSHAGGQTPPPDRHRIRIWILTPAEKARLDNPGDRLLDFREAIACSPGTTALQDGAIGPNGLAVPLGTAVFGVRAPDIDDGGEMDHGNHQLHPWPKECK